MLYKYISELRDVKLFLKSNSSPSTEFPKTKIVHISIKHGNVTTVFLCIL